MDTERAALAAAAAKATVNIERENRPRMLVSFYLGTRSY
jgi:hypothetical protein